MQMRQRRDQERRSHPEIDVLVHPGMSVSAAALAFISTIVGAGIVSLPYALQQAGNPYLGVGLHLMMTFCLMFAVYLYLLTKDNLKHE